MVSEAEIQGALSAYFDGINSERYGDVGALFAPEGELKAPGSPWLRGPKEVETDFTWPRSGHTPSYRATCPR